MRNLLVYYLVILAPFAALLLAGRLHLLSNEWFAAFILLYLPYRQCTDAWRLVQLGIIDKVTWKVIFNPFLQSHYFRELYWFKR